MIIRDLYRLGAVGRPAETDAPLRIDAYGVLSAAIALQCFQPISPRGTQVVQAGCRVHHIELAQCDALDIPPSCRTGAIAEQSLGGIIGKAAYHER
jgi:hypothetical protein